MGKGKGTNRGKGSGVEVGSGCCMICGEDDHWKGQCKWKGIRCKHCGGEHLNRLCGMKGKGKGEGKAKAAEGDGKGKGERQGGKGKAKAEGQKGAGKAADNGGEGKGGNLQLQVMCSSIHCGELNPPSTKFCREFGSKTMKPDSPEEDKQ